MTTTRYVNTGSSSGGDGTTNATTGDSRAYASLSEAEAGVDATLTDDWEIICSGAVDDTTRMVVSGITTSSINTLSVIQADTDRHDAVWGVNKYMLSVTDAEAYPGAIEIGINHVTIDGLQIGMEVRRSYSRGIFVYITSPTANSGPYIKNTFIRQLSNSGTYSSYGIEQEQSTIGTLVIENTIVCDSYSNGIFLDNGAGANIYNTIVYGGSDDGIERDTGTVVCKNCASFGNLDDFDGSITIDYCASDDGDGTNSVQPSNWANVFEDHANYDFRLKSTDTDLQGAGIGPSSDSDVPTLCIAGNTRSGTTCDIGAFEYVPVGPAGRPLPQRIFSGCFSGPFGGPI